MIVLFGENERKLNGNMYIRMQITYLNYEKCSV